MACLNSYIYQAVRHEGTPEGMSDEIRDRAYRLNGVTIAGKIESIGAKQKVEVYVATPTGEYDKTKAVLFFPDVFGMQFINSQVIDPIDGGSCSV